MATKLIQLADGTLVEAEVAPQEARPISGGAAEKVATSMEAIEPILVNVTNPIVKAWDAMTDRVRVDSVEVELGLSFEGEGSIFVSKAKAAASLTVLLKITRPQVPATSGAG